MITDIGYRTRCGLLLNIQCVTCGVWVAQERSRFVEFDGLRHSCAGRPFGMKTQVAKDQNLSLRIPA